jgi:hypothetical protein
MVLRSIIIAPVVDTAWVVKSLGRDDRMPADRRFFIVAPSRDHRKGKEMIFGLKFTFYLIAKGRQIFGWGKGSHIQSLRFFPG